MTRVHIDRYGNAFAAWLSGYRPSTQEGYCTAIADYTRVMGVSVADLERDGADFEEYRRRCEQWPLAQRTLATRISAVRSFLRFVERYRREREGGEAA